MSSCDSTMPSVFNKREPVAKKEHVCDECGNRIEVGEKYVSVFGVWDNDPRTIKQCKECAELERYMVNHCETWCGSYGALIDDAYDDIVYMDCKRDGVKFGAWRRYANTGNRRKKDAK